MRFGEEKGGTKIGWKRKFDKIDGTENPELFPQWLMTCRKEALNEQEDLRPQDTNAVKGFLN